MRRTMGLIILLLTIPGCTLRSPGSQTRAVTPAAEEQGTQPSSTATATRTPTTTPRPEATPTKPRPTLAPTPSPAPTNAPATESPFRRVTWDEGLRAGEIYHLWVAPDGRLWVAADTGVFVHDEGGWTWLLTGQAERVFGADGEGRIWVLLQVESAVAAYAPSGDWHFYVSDQGWTHPPELGYLARGYGDGLVTDPQGRVWLATGRDDLRAFDPASQTWKSYKATDLGYEPPEEPGYQGHFLADVALSGSQKVWVGDCIARGEGLTGQGIRWLEGNTWFPASATDGECVLDIEIDRASRMWVGAFDALLQYDPAVESWKRIPLPPWERRQLVTAIDLDADDNPWVEVMRYGGASPFGVVARFHLQDGAWVQDYEGWFSSLAFGREGDAWLCSEGQIYHLENGQAVAAGRVPGTECQIVVDGAGGVWVTGHYGLWWLEP